MLDEQEEKGDNSDEELDDNENVQPKNQINNIYVAPNGWTLIEERLPPGRCIRDCGGRGHCLFYTLSYWIFGDSKYAGILRLSTSFFLSKYENYERYVYTHVYTTEQLVSATDAYQKFLLDRHYETPEQYFQGMAFSNIFGEVEEAIAMGYLFAMNIDIYSLWSKTPKQIRPVLDSQVLIFENLHPDYNIQLVPPPQLQIPTTTLINADHHYRIAVEGTRDTSLLSSPPGNVQHRTWRVVHVHPPINLHDDLVKYPSFDDLSVNFGWTFEFSKTLYTASLAPGNVSEGKMLI